MPDRSQGQVSDRYRKRNARARRQSGHVGFERRRTSSIHRFKNYNQKWKREEMLRTILAICALCFATVAHGQPKASAHQIEVNGMKIYYETSC
jgi:hypothetical protein